MVTAEEWVDPGQGLPERTITGVDLYEISLCPLPAYETTTVALSRAAATADGAKRRTIAKMEAAMRRRGIAI